MTDLTDLVKSYECAAWLARAMLRMTPSQSPEIWQCQSEPILSALLYNASPQQLGGGLVWVNQAVDTLARDGGDTAKTLGISDPGRDELLPICAQHRTYAEIQ